jgi:hypothetical protein
VRTIEKLAGLLGEVRRNHALEHATISILMSRLGRDVRLVGRATRSGFYLYGDVPTDRLKESSDEALARLRRGEAHLAISPVCGTNVAVTGLLAGLSSLLALGSRSRAERAPSVLLASLLAVTAAQPVGRLIQKHVTTDPDLSDTEIVEVKEGGRGPVHYHRVRTARRRA